MGAVLRREVFNVGIQPAASLQPAGRGVSAVAAALGPSRRGAASGGAKASCNRGPGPGPHPRPGPRWPPGENVSPWAKKEIRGAPWPAPRGWASVRSPAQTLLRQPVCLTGGLWCKGFFCALGSSPLRPATCSPGLTTLVKCGKSCSFLSLLQRYCSSREMLCWQNPTVSCAACFLWGTRAELPQVVFCW